MKTEIDMFRGQLYDLLSREPELGSPSEMGGFPVNVAVRLEEEAWSTQCNNAYFELHQFGVFFKSMYRLRLRDLQVKHLKQQPLLSDIESYTYEIRAKDFMELRRSFDVQEDSGHRQWIPQLDRKGSKAIDYLVEQAQKELKIKFLQEREKSKVDYDLLRKVSFEYDQLVNKQGLSREAQMVTANAERNYNAFLQYIDNDDFFCDALLDVLKVGYRGLSEEEKSRMSEIIDHVDKLKQLVGPKQMSIHCAALWKNYYQTNVPVCIFEGQSRSEVSLLYALDPQTKFLFFDAFDYPTLPQAIAILFDAKDNLGKKWSVLEGVIMNKDFQHLAPSIFDGYFRFNKSLEDSERIPIFDLFLHHVLQYAHLNNTSLFINMNEVTTPDEYGPHEFANYLQKLFPEYRYGLEVVGDWRRDPQDRPLSDRKLVLSKDTTSGLYLRKDNSELLSILREYKIEIPATLFDERGRFLLYNHTWADLRSEKTWINPCEGDVRGIPLVPVSRIKK